MESIDAAFGGTASANLQFVALLVLGLFVGWALARPYRWCAWTTCLGIIGVCGAWLGAEAAHLIGQAPRGSVDQFLTALIGAGVLAYAWRRLHPRPDPRGGWGIAIHGPNA